MRRQGDTELLEGDRQFPHTEWDLLRPAPNLQSVDVLVRKYWKPLYFYVRRHGFDIETSKDIVQTFMANMVTRDRFSRADPKLGRFRTFVVVALSNFIKDWRRRSTRIKRGGGIHNISLDVASIETGATHQLASENDTPERVLNREWARTLLDEALGDLKGTPPHLAALRLYLEGNSYEQIGGKTGLSQTAAKVAVHRLRGKLRKLLIERIAETVGSECDLDAELSEFVALLSS
jgi:RNA polymerase sigma factor (sigma-70 family)